MVSADYLRLIGSEDDFTRSPAQVQAVADNHVRNHYLSESGPEQGRQSLAATMRAGADAGGRERRPVRIPGKPRLHHGRQSQPGTAGTRHACQAMRARDSAFTLRENELNERGCQLLRAGEPKQAVHIFRLATVLHPDSANAYDSLADSLEQAGDQAGAIGNYRRSLTLGPGNRNAQARLQVLAQGRQAEAKGVGSAHDRPFACQAGNNPSQIAPHAPPGVR